MSIWSRLKRCLVSLFPRKSRQSPLSGLFAQLPDERLQGILCSYLDGAAAPTQPIQAFAPTPNDQDTGEINEHAVQEALSEQRKMPITDKIGAMPLDAGLVEDLVRRLPPGELALAYWDSHRGRAMGDETRIFRVTRRKTGKLGEWP